MFYRGLHGRVTKLETDVAAIGSDVKEVRDSVSGVGDAVSRLSDSLLSTDGRAAERAHQVKREMRDEDERKGKERNSTATLGFGLVTTIAIIVAALTGPWKEKLETTSSGQAADTAAVAAVREVLAQQGAGIGRVQAGLDIQRDNGARRDAELREHDQEIAFIKGVMADRGLPTR